MVVRKPSTPARRPAATKKTAAPAPVRRTATPTRKAAVPASAASESKREQLARARAAKAVKDAAAKEKASANPHPIKKDTITANDVLRSFHTFNVIYSEWLQQQGDEMTEVLEFVAPIIGAPQGVPKKSPLTRAKVEPEERLIEEYYNRDDIEAYNIKELRELAADLVANGIITEKVKKLVILEQMEAAGLFREEGSADSDEDDIEEDDDEDVEEDEDEEDDDESGDDDDDTEEENFTRAELKAMSLKALQDLAELNEFKWKGLDKDDLINTLLGGSDDEEEDEDGEEEEEGLEIDPDELPNMSLPELLDLCKQIGLKVPATSRKNSKAVISIITEFLDSLPE